jgi:hypothetical protein
MTIILILPLLILFNEQNQVPCNILILFFPDHFQPLEGLLDCQLGRYNYVGGVW